MADRKISQFALLGAGQVSSQDSLPIVDASAGDAAGGNKRITVLALQTLLGGTAASVENAVRAETAAAQAALYEGVWLDNVAAVVADAALTYGAGPGHVDVGAFVRTRVEGFVYEVLPLGAASPDLTTAGGVLLRVMRGTDGFYPLDAFNPAATAGTDDTAIIQRAISRGPVRLGRRRYWVNGLQPVSDMHIAGDYPNFAAGQSMLCCAVAGGTIFNDAAAPAIHNVTLEDFCADATAPGVVFWNSPSQVKYSSMYRINRLILSKNFTLLFRAIPIYWIIDDCNFGQNGNRLGGTQEFRVMEAWANSTAVPINFNKVVNTRHYGCAAGSTYFAAYTLRMGSSWTFENCSAEGFPSACIVDARAFGGLQWLDGWIEWISYHSHFVLSSDPTAPQNISSSPMVIDGARFYIGDTVPQRLVQNPTALVSLRNILMTGVVGHMVGASNAVNVAELINVQGAPAAFFRGMQVRRQHFVARVSPWRFLPASRISTALEIGSSAAPIEDAASISGSGDTIARFLFGDRGQAYYIQVPPDILETYQGSYLTVAVIGQFESVPAAAVTACYWAGVVPNYNNMTGVADGSEVISGASAIRLSISRCGVFVPSNSTYLHIGFTANGLDVGKRFRLEGLHLLAGDYLATRPFFV